MNILRVSPAAIASGIVAVPSPFITNVLVGLGLPRWNPSCASSGSNVFVDNVLGCPLPHRVENHSLPPALVATAFHTPNWSTGRIISSPPPPPPSPLGGVLISLISHA